MPTLADSVIGIAQDTNKQVAGSGADALQAFHIAATAEHARQELDMEKDKQTMNKANWLTTQLDGISRMSPGVQKIALDSFQKQAGQVLGGSFNPEVVSALKADEDLRKSSFAHAAGVLSGGAIKTPEDATAILNLYGGSVQDATAGITTLGQHHMAMLGQQAKAAAIQTSSTGRVQNGQDSNTQAMADKFDKDTNITALLKPGQALGRDLKTLTSNDPKKPVTYQTLHETLMNVANVLGGGSLSDARVGAITPLVNDEFRAKIDSFASNNPNQAADPRYVKYALDLATRLHGAVKSDVRDRANQIYSGRDDPEMFHNPNLSKMAQAKHAYYTSGKWMEDQSNAAQAAASPRAPKPGPGSVVESGGKRYKVGADGESLEEVQ